MGKLNVIASASAAFALASVLVWQHFSNESLRQDNERLKQFLAASRQLSDVTTPVSKGETMGDEQKAELLKLRAEETQLRAETNRIGMLTEANQKLKDSLREVRTVSQSTTSKKKGPEDALPQDIHPKDSWAFRGYGTPDATIESTLWAMMSGDKATILAAFAPDMLPEIQKQMEKTDFAEEIKKVNMAEFRVLDRQQLSPDEMVLTVYTSRQDPNGNVNGSTENTVFDRINGQWKVTKKSAPND